VARGFDEFIPDMLVVIFFIQQNYNIIEVLSIDTFLEEHMYMLQQLF